MNAKASVLAVCIGLVIFQSTTASAQQVTSTSEDIAWNQAASKNTVEAYLDFSIVYPDSSNIKLATGTVRGRFWLSMGDNVVMSGGKATAVGGGQGVLVTVAATDALAMLSIEEAIARGVIGYKPAAVVRSGTELKISVTSFDVTSWEMRGPCLVKDKTSSNADLAEGLLLEPKDMNASVVLSADGKRLLAWDMRSAKVAEHADVSLATYPNSARKSYSGLNPESQTATYTQRKP